MSINVLIADDSATMRGIIHRCLQMGRIPLGKVFEAADGREALQIIAGNWVDLILTDINMPNMDGAQLLAALEEDPVLSSIPVIVVSAEAVASSDFPRAARVITKPFMPEELVSAVQEVTHLT